MGERRYSPLPAYAQSKLANVLFTYELARRLKGTGVSVNCLHPGLVRTKITSGLSGPGRWLARLERPFARAPERSARTVAYLASSPDVEGVSGRYFVNKRERRSTRRSYDTALARRLWEVSERLSGTSRRENRPTG